jgi:glycosyltransferase involved in cell wall biosynthesis
VRALAQQHQVTVVCPAEVPLSGLFASSTADTQAEGWRVYRPRYARLAGKVLPLYLLTALRWSRWIDWSTVDIIHVHVALPAGFIAALLARIYRKPLVITEHAGDFPTWIKPLVRRLLFHTTIKQAACVMLVSRSLQRQIEQAGIITRFAVVPNIVNTQLFHIAPVPPVPEPGVFRLLWVGGSRRDYYRRKGGTEVLQAAALAHPHLAQRLALTLIVDGPARDLCQQELAPLGIDALCTLVGMMSNREVRDLMQQCDALILASHSESFGMVLVEALSCGTPVIATRCGGPEEIITPETGLLVEPGNPQALADAIIQMAATHHSYDPHALAAYAERHFGAAPVVQHLTRIYVEARSTPHQL